MLTIKLMIHGKEQEYAARRVTLRASLTAYELYRDYERASGDYSGELLERCAEFVRDIFGRSFSLEELLDGYQGSAFRLYPGILNAVVGYSSEAIINFPSPAMAPAEATRKG